jgi:hypothetical protein
MRGEGQEGVAHKRKSLVKWEVTPQVGFYTGLVTNFIRFLAGRLPAASISGVMG